MKYCDLILELIFYVALQYNKLIIKFNLYENCFAS